MGTNDEEKEPPPTAPQAGESTTTEQAGLRTVPCRFDRVLADVVCSSDGTLRKTPDLWRSWHSGMGHSIHRIQLSLLRRAALVLAPGGRIVYSTCSLNPVEDEAVVATILSANNGKLVLEDLHRPGLLDGLRRQKGVSSWELMDRNKNFYANFQEVPQAVRDRDHMFRTMLPPDDVTGLNLERCMRILPHHNNTGGFFVAVLRHVGLPALTVTPSAPAPPRPPLKPGVAFPGSSPFAEPSDEVRKIVRTALGFGAQWDDSLMFTHLPSCRNLYLVSPAVRDFLHANLIGARPRLCVVSAGVRVLEAARGTVDKWKCAVEGLSAILPFIPRERLGPLPSAEISKMFANKQKLRYFSDLSLSARAAVSKIPVGVFVAFAGPSIDAALTPQTAAATATATTYAATVATAPAAEGTAGEAAGAPPVTADQPTAAAPPVAANAPVTEAVKAASALIDRWLAGDRSVDLEPVCILKLAGRLEHHLNPREQSTVQHRLDRVFGVSPAEAAAADGESDGESTAEDFPAGAPPPAKPRKE
eukprot:NODE_219_length_1794_cov_69.110602_g168_i0.p1 GENE.NODE_219_length_1794_cov_69.110602_g168_i0~~NODE_219_length_1794_cov_69.110602_g168_i0.p1  ORF type:complete len:531 (+),score=159.32 NODE_219_length_1794_cov_69.110602_g168_i0:33-1625(+)